MKVTTIIERQKHKDLKTLLQKEERSAWEGIRGLWKRRRANPVAYQRKLREAADRRIP